MTSSSRPHLPKVTVAIPTVSRLAYLQEAVTSVLTQQYPNIHIVISQDPDNNGLHTEIQNWANQFAGSNPRVSYRINAQPKGLAGNWNEILNCAEGEYLLIIGDDDRLLPSCIQRLVNAQEQYFADVVFSNQWFIDSLGERLGKETDVATIKYCRHLLSEGIQNPPHLPVWRNSVPMTGSLIKTELAKQLRFREDLNTPEIEFYARAAQSGARFAFVKDYLSEYRLHSFSATATGLKFNALYECLELLHVPQDVEPIKKQLLAVYLSQAVSIELRAGNALKARKYSKSKYFPKGMALIKNPRSLLKMLLTRLPLTLLDSLVFPILKRSANVPKKMFGKSS